MVSSASYDGEEENSDSLHHFLRSVLLILTCYQNSSSRTILCISNPIVLKCKCRCPVVCGPMIIRDLSEVTRYVYRENNIRTSLLALVMMKVESTWLSGRCQPRRLHIRRRVHVDHNMWENRNFPLPCAEKHVGSLECCVS